MSRYGSPAQMVAEVVRRKLCAVRRAAKEATSWSIEVEKLLFNHDPVSSWDTQKLVEFLDEHDKNGVLLPEQEASPVVEREVLVSDQGVLQELYEAAVEFLSRARVKHPNDKRPCRLAAAVQAATEEAAESDRLGHVRLVARKYYPSVSDHDISIHQSGTRRAVIGDGYWVTADLWVNRTNTSCRCLECHKLAIIGVDGTAQHVYINTEGKLANDTKTDSDHKPVFPSRESI